MTLSVLLLTNPTKRQALERALALLVEQEIASKQGVEGQLLKMVYTNSQKLLPGVLTKAITLTLPGLITDFEPEYTQAQRTTTPFSRYLLKPECQPSVTKAVLTAFDKMSTQYPLLKPLYLLIRGRIEHHAVLAIPRLSSTLQPFTG
jgi:hypothetical protein